MNYHFTHWLSKEDKLFLLIIQCVSMLLTKSINFNLHGPSFPQMPVRLIGTVLQWIHHSFMNTDLLLFFCPTRSPFYQPLPQKNIESHLSYFFLGLASSTFLSVYSTKLSINHRVLIMSQTKASTFKSRAVVKTKKQSKCKMT